MKKIELTAVARANLWHFIGGLPCDDVAQIEATLRLRELLALNEEEKATIDYQETQVQPGTVSVQYRVEPAKALVAERELEDAVAKRLKHLIDAHIARFTVADLEGWLQSVRVQL